VHEADAPPCPAVASAARRRPRAPLRELGHRLEHRDGALVLQVPDAELDGIGARSIGELVDERFVGEGVLREPRPRSEDTRQHRRLQQVQGDLAVRKT